MGRKKKKNKEALENLVAKTCEAVLSASYEAGEESHDVCGEAATHQHKSKHLCHKHYKIRVHADLVEDDYGAAGEDYHDADHLDFAEDLDVVETEEDRERH